jgi:Outer membrane protein beta-barrel domain
MRLCSRFTVLTACILTALLLTPAAASAQTPPVMVPAAGASTSFGVQGGLNVANVDVKSADPDEFTPDFKSRNRAVFGGFVAWDFNPAIGLQIDVLYSQKGTKFSFVEDDGTDITFELGADYVEFPVLVRTNFGASGPVRFRLFGGPSFGFKVLDETTITVAGVEPPDDPDDQSETKGSDFGFVVGGAVEFGKVFVDFRYNWGLININDDPNDEDEVKTRTFGFMVGFRFK